MGQGAEGSKAKEVEGHISARLDEKSSITLRVEEIRQEIAQIQNDNRVYQSSGAHDRSEIILHQRRGERLREIKAELYGLLRRSST